MARIEIDLPIQFDLSRRNMERLIDNHGQFVRWRKGEKSSDILSSGRINPNVSKTRYRYTFQSVAKKVSIRLDLLQTGIAKFPEKNIISVDRVYSQWRKLDDNIRSVKIWEDYELVDDFLCFSGEKPKFGDVLFADYSVSLIPEIERNLVQVNDNIFRLDEGYTDFNGVLVPGDIESVVSITNVTQDIDYTVSSFNRNWIIINTPPAPIDTGDIITSKVKYFYPFKMLILSQTGSETLDLWLREINADCQCTYYDYLDIAEGDIITPLLGNRINRYTFSYSGNDYDTIPEWHVKEIIRIHDSNIDYTDYKLVNGDSDGGRILWGANRPSVGMNVSVEYKYHPTYKVLDTAPQFRSQENQFMPRKVALRRFVFGGDSNEPV